MGKEALSPGPVLEVAGSENHSEKLLMETFASLPPTLEPESQRQCLFVIFKHPESPGGSRKKDSRPQRGGGIIQAI